MIAKVREAIAKEQWRMARLWAFGDAEATAYCDAHEVPSLSPSRSGDGNGYGDGYGKGNGYEYGYGYGGSGSSNRGE